MRFLSFKFMQLGKPVQTHETDIVSVIFIGSADIAHSDDQLHNFVSLLSVFTLYSLVFLASGSGGVSSGLVSGAGVGSASTFRDLIVTIAVSECSLTVHLP